MPHIRSIESQHHGHGDDRLSRALHALERSHGRRLMLLPSEASVVQAKERLAEVGSIGVTAAAFTSYLSDIWSSYGDGRRLVRGSQRDLLMRRVLRGAAAPKSRSTDAVTLRALVRMAEAAALSASPVSADDPDPLLSVVGRYLGELRERRLSEPGEAVALLGADPPEPPRLVAVPYPEALSGPTRVYLRALSTVGVEVRMEGRGPEDGTVEPSRPAGQTAFVACEDEEAECDLFVSMALEALSRGSRPERIALVPADLAASRRLLKQRLSGRGVEAIVEAPMPLKAAPLGRALIHLASFCLFGAPDELLAFLRSPYSHVDPRRCEEIERSWLTERPRSAASLLHLLKGSPQTHRMISAARLLLEQPLTPSGVVDWDGLSRLMLRSAHGANEMADAARLDVLAHKGAIGTLSALADEQAFGVSGTELLEVLSSIGLPAPLPQHGRVNVLPPRGLKGRVFDLVVLADPGGGSTPPPDPLGAGAAMSSALRLALALPSAHDSPAAFVSDAREAAKGDLVLTRRKRDAQGDRLPPSALWLQLMRAAGAQESEPDADPDLGKTDRDDRDPTSCSVRGARDGRKERVVPPRAVRGGRHEEGGSLQAVGGGTGRLAEREVFSATELEIYLSCPRRWFLQRWLRTERPDEGLGPKDAGRLVHSTLRETFNEATLGWRERRPTGATLGRWMEAAKSHFDSLAEGVPLSGTLREEDLMRTGWRQVESLMRRSAAMPLGWEPGSLEWSFGLGALEVPPVGLDGFSLEGTVDRVDRRDGLALVIDYKTGRPLKPREAAKRGAVQLPLYAAVVSRVFEEPVVGAVMMSPRSPGFGGLCSKDVFSEGELPGSQRVSQEALEEAVDVALLAARSAADGIRAGRIPAEPASDEICGWCEHADTCGAKR